jgi:hypothetical protein
MKTVHIILLILLLIFGVFIYKGWQEKSLYEDIISVRIFPSQEPCDEYKVLWKIDSVSSKEYGFVVGDLIYLTNAKANYRNDSLSIFIATGRLLKEKKEEHYIGCIDSWFFEDKSISL